MTGFSAEEFSSCKKWIATKIQEGFSWEDVLHFCVPVEEARDQFNFLQTEELILPPNLEFDQWEDLVKTVQSSYTPIVDLYGISGGTSNVLPVPTDSGSAWVRYKNHLLGKYSGKAKMSDSAVDTLENNCHWILNHLKRDTRTSGAVKGLVMGSVQSGKTANMIGVVTMAAHYDWNIFIILSGTIDNLRKQTRDRFYNDLSQSGGVSWHILDHTGKPEYMKDISNDKRYLSDDLSLNSYQNGIQSSQWMHRYVIVCLKNSRRLSNLIKWLHANPARAARMRIIVIDDEADQASINTVKMADVRDEDEIERTAVNQLIIDLIKGNDDEGNLSKAPFQAMNYISFTATPYANVLNEAYEDSLYPKNFICSLPESKDYFGSKAIWGSKTDENYSGLNIIRTVPDGEVKEVKQLHKGQSYSLPSEFKNSIAWFLCASAILRKRGYKKSISMLIHTTSIQNGHFEEYDVLKNWLTREGRSGTILALCKKIYEKERNEFRLKDLLEDYPEYASINKVDDTFPEFYEFESEITELLSDVVNIEMGEDKALSYTVNGLHLCVDNCRANKVAEEGTFLRIVYPSDKQLEGMKKAPVFIVMGGNTLSRGLTLEGLVCTYFARNVNQADTLMQMARWFGYRHGYELLQRIWMPKSVQDKFELIAEIDEKLKAEFEDYMKKGKSPAEFGPRIMNSAKIAKFVLTSKNKSQNMVSCDVDFSGDSYEITKFDDNPCDLSHNLTLTNSFLRNVGTPSASESIDGAFVWFGIDSKTIISEFLNEFRISNNSSLSTDIPIFIEWMKQMNDESKFLKWNIAIAGDKQSSGRWTVDTVSVGKIERSKKSRIENYIDIGSLRSGRDILADILISKLNSAQKKEFEEGKKSGKNLISLRHKLGLGDVPLLLLYCIDKDKGKASNNRSPINSQYDIIGFSIVLAGEEVQTGYVKTVHVKKPD